MLQVSKQKEVGFCLFDRSILLFGLGEGPDWNRIQLVAKILYTN